MAALLGAEEYGFGSVSMNRRSCMMARICHTNNCPVGWLRKKKPLRKALSPACRSIVGQFLPYVAEEVRPVAQPVGFARLKI